MPKDSIPLSEIGNAVVLTEDIVNALCNPKILSSLTAGQLTRLANAVTRELGGRNGHIGKIS